MTELYNNIPMPTDAPEMVFDKILQERQTLDWRNNQPILGYEGKSTYNQYNGTHAPIQPSLFTKNWLNNLPEAQEQRMGPYKIFKRKNEQTNGYKVSIKTGANQPGLVIECNFSNERWKYRICNNQVADSKNTRTADFDTMVDSLNNVLELQLVQQIHLPNSYDQLKQDFDNSRHIKAEVPLNKPAKVS
jgi:hypothetical protein